MSHLIPKPSVLNVYGAGTPNFVKVQILLEEKNIPHVYHKIDFSKNEQFDPEFLKFSPNNKIPAIVDNTVEPGISVFESAAILMYLSESRGLTDLYSDFKSNPALHAKHLEFLFFQMSGVGPMTGQLGWFSRQPEPKNTQAIERYAAEVKRLYGVLDKVLETNTWVAGEQYSIADISLLGWALYLLKGYYNEHISREEFPNVYRWLDLASKRPAIIKVLETIQQKQK
ncbi:hypothetical protein RB653_010023 [Dictyostelium firmibasis]|uniref:Glutathione S-transferase n=1 Tax=Dictyostelium firmibasis TaxID=79012 RepID=A0AAN7TYM2_9MYCE